MSTIRTRFAPSPTGFLHVGGARTALFNWLYARHTGGTFILRIEDTDLARSTEQSVQAIFDALAWLGIDWDEGPFYQSRRLAIYNQHIDRLVDEGHAYYCTCSADQIERMRERARAKGAKPKYNGTCREKGLAPTPGAVVRFKAPVDGTTVVADKVKGDIVFANEEQDDFILRRSDGMPTYNLAAVVDDASMAVNTIIRGDDHVMNTPKQILLYQALGSPLPEFAHVPMVLGNDRTRMSKRHGATSVTAYRDMGLLPDALINFLARLGWSYGDQEFFTRQELIEKFDLDRVGKSAGIFDAVKLNAINADHIQAATAQAIAPQLLPFLAAQGWQAHDDAYLHSAIATLQPRSKTLQEMALQAHFYYNEGLNLDEKAAKKFLKGSVLEPLRDLRQGLAELDGFDEPSLERIFVQLMEKFEIKLGKIAQPVRVALTGTSVSPGIFEIMVVLGKQRVLDRLDRAIDYIESSNG
ncbi:MAG: glutamate--tRNA ligase [Desulfatitalea sp.]|nr:glutamate--tRNA ligase [Desulfatitalea sp.]NNJ98898.1 glutamate--tRNA ligase [Desulfatitalea sp.]